MSVMDTKEKRRLRRMNPVASLLRMDLMLQYMDITTGLYTGPSAAGANIIAGSGGLSANDIVYVSNYDSTEGKIEVLPADADTAAKARDIFWTSAAIADGATGFVFKQGSFTSTLSGTIGDPVYLSPGTAGEVTLSEPTGTDVVVQIGTLATSGANGVVHVDLGGERIMVHDHADRAGGGTLSTPALTGTTNTTFEVDAGTTHTSLILSAATAGSTGKSTTLKAASSADDYTVTVPDPGGNSKYVAYTDQSDGSVVTTTSTGTTNISFETYTGTAEPSIAISGSSGGTGDFTQTIQAAAIVTVGDATFLLPDTASAGDTIVCKTIAETLANKTLTAPVINAATITGNITITTPTIIGTWANLGNVTTVNIDGGTVDATIIGGATPAAITGTTITGTTITDGDFSVSSGAITGVKNITSASGAYAFDYSNASSTFKTSTGKNTLNGNVDIAANKYLELLTGTGFIQVNAATSGAIKILPKATTTSILTIDSIAQTQGTTISYPDVNAATDTLATLGVANAFTGACTFASITGNDADLTITGTIGSSSVGRPVTIAGGAADGAGNAGGAILNTTGAGVAETAGTGGDSGAFTTVTGAPGTATTGQGGDSGAVSITTGTGGAATGGTSIGGASGAVTLASGTGGDADNASACTGGAGGLLSLTGGTGGTADDAASTGGDGGSIQMYAGIGGASSGGTAGDGGSVTIRAGSGDTNGSITIGATNAAAVAIGRTGITTSIPGTLTLSDGTTPAMTLAAGSTNTGTITVNGKTSGSLIITAADATAEAVTFSVAAQTVGAGSAAIPDLTNSADEFAMVDLAQTLTNKELTSPLVGTRLDMNAVPGAATSVSKTVVRKNGIGDAAATSVLQFTCPNAAHAAVAKITILASVDDQESVRCAQGLLVFSRVAASNVVGTAAGLVLDAIATGGAETLTLAYSLAAAVGAAGASNTMDMQVTCNTSAAADSEVIVICELINSEATGITVAAV